MLPEASTDHSATPDVRAPQNTATGIGQKPTPHQKGSKRIKKDQKHHANSRLAKKLNAQAPKTPVER